MTFDFATAGRILFGPGTSDQVPALARDLGTHALLVLGGSRRGVDCLAAGLAGAGVSSSIFSVPEEPTVELVREATALARAEGCDLVISVGGGSVIDAGKAAAALLSNPGDVMDYLEVVGGGKPLVHPSAPFIAVPTTAGTGTEVTRNAVLGVPEHHVKVSLRGSYLLPRIAIIDPRWTYTLPTHVTAFCGMDALTQLIEPLVSNAANPFTDALCREGIRLAAKALPAVFNDPADEKARESMSLAALFSGIALANARLGAVHGLAGVLGGTTGHPHGAICARLLPLVMEANIQALEHDAASSPILDRYREVACLLTGNPLAAPLDGVSWVEDLSRTLGIPPLPSTELSRPRLAPVIVAAQRASSMKGNPVKLSDETLEHILEQAT